MKRLLILFLGFFFSLNAFCSFVSTNESPVALKGIYGNTPYTLYVYDDGNYLLFEANNKVLTGTWTETPEQIKFGSDGLANKVNVYDGEESLQCLQAVFYGIERYRYIADIYCRRERS